MTILLNGKKYEVREGMTLSSFIEEQGISKEGIAVAIDYKVIPKKQWDRVPLTENLEIMLIQAISGG